MNHNQLLTENLQQQKQANVIITESEFIRAINVLDEKNKKIVFDQLEASRQKIMEAQIEWESVLHYLKFQLKNHDNMEPGVSDTTQAAQQAEGSENEGAGNQQLSLYDETGSVNDDETDSEQIRKGSPDNFGYDSSVGLGRHIRNGLSTSGMGEDGYIGKTGMDGTEGRGSEGHPGKTPE